MGEADQWTDRPGLLNRMMIRLMPFFSRMHVWIYRNLGGRFAGKTPAGGPILVLTTTGRRSKKRRSVALGYLDAGDHFYIVASNGGQATEPGWSHNLKTDPRAEVQYRDREFHTDVELLEDEERDRAWQRFVTAYPDYAQAQHWAGREFPLYRIPVPRAD